MSRPTVVIVCILAPPNRGGLNSTQTRWHFRAVGGAVHSIKSGLMRRKQTDGMDQGYSITSSARARNVGGISIPSALAVFRLITNSNLVGCITGKSAGLSPLRILPT